MRIKSIFTVFIILLLAFGLYNQVDIMKTVKKTDEKNKSLVETNKKIKKENDQLTKVLDRLEGMKETESDNDTNQETELDVDSTNQKENTQNMELEKVNKEFVSVTFNFNDSVERSTNMKAYMTENLKKDYVKNDEIHSTSELENINIIGELKQYKLYTERFENGKINAINDVVVTYGNGFDKIENRVMFSVKYDEGSLKVEDIQFIPVINTE